MTLRPILRWPDPRLAQVCAPVDDVKSVRTLAQDMLETMYAAPGRGLAAPQVGELVRLFVMDTSGADAPPAPMICINPSITNVDSPLVEMDEGCLSIPGIRVSVPRPSRVALHFADGFGTQHNMQLDGFAALCAQHELDHLNGIVTLDRINQNDRSRLIAEYEAQ